MQTAFTHHLANKPIFQCNASGNKAVVIVESKTEKRFLELVFAGANGKFEASGKPGPDGAYAVTSGGKKLDPVVANAIQYYPGGTPDRNTALDLVEQIVAHDCGINKPDLSK